MKLYATTTSERASKGQGGNKHILSVFTAEIGGQRQEIASVSIVFYENEVTGNYYNVEMITPSHKVIVEKVAEKGNKKKGEI